MDTNKGQIGAGFFNANSLSRTEAFRQYLESNEISEPVRSVVKLLASDEFSASTFDEIVITEIQPRNLDIQQNLLDLVLVFARRCVDDHRLSEEEISELKKISTIFRISKGDFRRLRRDAVNLIVYAQTVWILEDNYVTEEEEIRQNDLQRLFGFSYDQYVSLLRALAKQHIKRLESRIMGDTEPEELKLIDASIQNLRSVFLVRQL